MKITSKAASIAALVATAAAAPALADYVITEDPAFPSVLYFEFEGYDDTSAGQVPAPGSTAVLSTSDGDPALPSSDEGSQTEPSTSHVSVSSDVNTRANDRAREIETMDAQAIEDAAIEAVIEDQLLQQTDPN